MDPIRLTGPDVLLSVPTSDDVDAITAAGQDPEITEWTTLPAPYTREHAEGFLVHMVVPGWTTGRDLVWAIRESDGAFAGMCGLHGVADGAGEVGYWVAPWARGRGLVSQGVAAVLDHAFAPEGLGLVRVQWRAYVGNWPSRRVAWRAGFRFEGTVRLGGLQRGRRRDEWVAGLLRGDAREPAEAWPDDAPPDNRAVVPDAPPVPLDAAARGRAGRMSA